jgi:hypothetical protein
VIRRESGNVPIQPEPKPVAPAIKPTRRSAPVKAQPPPAPTKLEPPPPTSLPLGGPAAIQPTLIDLVLIPEPMPDNRAIAISLPPDQAAAAQRAADDADARVNAIASFSEDSGVVLSAATKQATEPVAQKRRRVWPWIVVVIVLLGAGAAAYLYFVEGLVPDLDYF